MELMCKVMKHKYQSYPSQMFKKLNSRADSENPSSSSFHTPNNQNSQTLWNTEHLFSVTFWFKQGFEINS